MLSFRDALLSAITFLLVASLSKYLPQSPSWIEPLALVCALIAVVAVRRQS